MPLSQNQRLADVLTRHQIYIEGVKSGQSRDFNYVLATLSIELRRLLGKVKYRTLDGMSKAELNKFVGEVRKVQSRIYSAYTQDVLKQLKHFMRTDLSVNRRMFASLKLEFDGEEDVIPEDDEATDILEQAGEENNFLPLFGFSAIKGNGDRLWSSITNTPIPANGLYLIPFVTTFSQSAQASVEQIIRKAWANGWTLEETIAEITGESARQGTSSQLQRIGVQAGAVIATAIQHVAAFVGAGVASVLFGSYTWISVIDGSTTTICRSRNRRVYRFREGPLPPAHIRCRSHITPIVGKTSDDIADETYYTWLARQPAKVQDEVLGATGGDALRSGELSAKDLVKYEKAEPLTFAQFAEKIVNILAR